MDGHSTNGWQRTTDNRTTTLRRARCVTVFCKKRKAGKKGSPGAAPAEEAGVDSQSADDPGAFFAAPPLVRSSFRRPKATPEELEAARKQQVAEEQERKRMSLHEVQHHASRKEDMKVVLVDGYNVIGCWPALAALATLPAKRRQLESYLAAYALVNKRVVSVVYDSMKSFRAQPSSPTATLSGLSDKVIYSFSGQDSADKVLRDQADGWVRLGAAEIVVVSNDKQVQHDCMRPEVDMSAMRSDWLIAQCVEAHRRVKARAEQEAARKLRTYREMLRALGVGSWTEATMLPEARLKAVGLSVKKTQELMMLLG